MNGTAAIKAGVTSVRRATAAILAALALVGAGRAEEPPRSALAAPAPGGAIQPGPNDRNTALLVKRLLEREHFLRQPIDDAMSRRWFDSFLESLDHMKAYFTQADIDGFSSRREQLDDLVRRGDVSFAYEVMERFLQRVDERLPVIERLIDEPHDFTRDESLVTDRKALAWPASDAEAEDTWRKRIKYDLLVQKMEDTPIEEAKDKLRRRYRSHAKRMHQRTAAELLEIYLLSLSTSFDPHSAFMIPDSAENFDIQMRLQLDGIGAQLKSEDGYTTIVELTPGGAADRDGRLKSKDRVVGVGQGADGDIVDTVDMNLNEVVKLIRGRRGTVVRLKVIPGGETAPKIYDITRDKIELKDAEARGEIIEHGAKADGSPYRIGVINLPSFYMDMAAAQQGQADFKSSARDTKRLLDEFRAKGIDCVVLDLRNNGGGSLQEAIKLTGLFIDRGPVLQVKDTNQQVRPYDDTDPGVSWDGPLVVLTNKFSASASEILAGAIQDYHRGLIVGDEATHGKGTVQSLLDLGRTLFPRLDNAPSLGAIKVTVQQFYLPGGASTQLEGVKSDVVLPSITTHLPVGEGDLDHAIAFDRVPPARYKPEGRVSEAVVEALRRRSAERVAGNKEFAEILDQIARYNRRKQEKAVSLLESEFARQWNEGKAAETEEEKRLEESEFSKRPVVKRDYYFDEAMEVTVDYLRALSGTGELAEAARPTTPRKEAVPVLQ